MKRSEIVQGIKDYLDITEADPKFLPDSLERANYILDFCEMLGMLPPERTRPATEYEKKVGTDKNSFLGIKVENTWEPEE